MRFLAIHLFYVMVGGPLHSANGNQNILAVIQFNELRWLIALNLKSGNSYKLKIIHPHSIRQGA